MARSGPQKRRRKKAVAQARKQSSAQSKATKAINSATIKTPSGRRQQTFRQTFEVVLADGSIKVGSQTYHGPYAKLLRSCREAGKRVEFTAEVRVGGNLHRATVDFTGKPKGIHPDYLLYTDPPARDPWEATIEFIRSSPRGYKVRRMEEITVTVL